MENKIRHMSDADALEFLRNEDSHVAIAVFLLPVEDGDKTRYVASVAIDKTLDAEAMAATFDGLMRCLAEREDFGQVMDMAMDFTIDEDGLWS